MRSRQGFGKGQRREALAFESIQPLGGRAHYSLIGLAHGLERESCMIDVLSRPPIFSKVRRLEAGLAKHDVTLGSVLCSRLSHG